MSKLFGLLNSMIDKINSSVKVTSQKLDDEQRAQARRNIGADGLDWHETEPGSAYTTYIANVGINNGITDWDKALSIKGGASGDQAVLDNVARSVASLLDGSSKSINKANFVNRFLSNIGVLVDSGYITLPWGFAFAVNETARKVGKISYCAVSSQSNGRWLLRNLENDSKYFVIKTDGTYADNTVVYPDDTLTKSNRAADAKAVGDALALKADAGHNHDDAYYTETEIDEALATKISYTEQPLTDEQRAQARANIAEFQYDWRQVDLYIGTAKLADWHACYNTGTSPFDIDEALAVTNILVPNSGKSALGIMHYFIDMLYAQRDMNREVSGMMPLIIAEFDALCNAGVTDGKMCVCVQNNINEGIEYTYVISKSDTSAYPYHLRYMDANGIIHATVNYNNETGEYDFSRSMPSSSDETLSIRFYAADAKAVGDALAKKVSTVNNVEPDKNGNVEIDALPDDTEQIAMLIEADMFPAVHENGAILTDENGNVILRY